MSRQPGENMTVLTRSLARFTALTVVTGLGLTIVLLFLALQRNATVTPVLPMTENERSTVEQLLVDATPGDLHDAELHLLSLDSGELDLLLRYIAESVGRDADLFSRISLPGQELLAELSLPVQSRLIPLYINIRARFVSTGETLSLRTLRVGNLQIPGTWVHGLAGIVEQRYLAEIPSYRGIQELLDSVRHVEIAANRLQLELEWDPDLLVQLRHQAQQFLVTTADQERMARYHRELTQIINAVPETTRAIPLSALLAPLFTKAAEISMAGGDPVAENRSLLLAAAAYVNEEEIEQWLGSELTAAIPGPRWIEVRVQRRQDLAQHIMSSAAIAASAGMGVARIISSVKENYDARYRSGFSFSDLTANTAGMALGNLATRSRSTAEELQRRMSNVKSDAEILPQLDGNRDGMSESDFSARYRHENSAEYRTRLTEIENLIYQQPLFAGLPHD